MPKKLQIAFSIHPDENYFNFKVIFATGVTVVKHCKDNNINIKRYEMMPIYVKFNEDIFMFQQILVHGKYFNVTDNENFFKDGYFDTHNKYYVGNNYLKSNNLYDDLCFSQSLKYFNLDYTDNYKNDFEIIDISVSPLKNFIAVFNDDNNNDDDNHNNNDEEKNIMRDKIRKTLEKSDFVQQIKSIVNANPNIIENNINMENYFSDDGFETKCDVDFFVVEGYVKFDK